jgi:hypothetical protein
VLIVKRIKKLIAIIKRGAPSFSRYLVSDNDVIITNIIRGSAVGNEWDDYRRQIVVEFQQHPMDFLRQPVISRTVHPNQQEIANEYLVDLSKDKFSRENILPRLHDLPIGNPYVCDNFPLASTMSMQHAYYLSIIRDNLGVFIPDGEIESITELGGGYGNFCRIVYGLGYTGNYSILDLSEMHSIQRHFLSYGCAPQINNKLIGFYSLSDQEILPKSSRSLFMATFSLSEMPLQSRLEIEEIYQHFGYLFFAYNSSFGVEDNEIYFSELKQRLASNFELHLIKDKHRRVWFLFGKRLSVDK